MRRRSQFERDADSGLFVPRSARGLHMGAPQQALLAGGGASGGGSGPTIASADVVCYLKMDGSGATFADSGPNGLTVTANGSATQSAVAGAFGGIALACGANTTDHINIAANALFSLTDFTFTGRMRWPSGAPTNGTAVLDLDGYASGISMRIFQTGSLRLNYYYLGSGPDSSNVLAEVGTDWHEFAMCRSGSTVYLLWDGVLEGTFASRGFSFGATPALRIGGVLAGGIINAEARQYDDILIASTALYTANYTPRTDAFTLT